MGPVHTEGVTKASGGLIRLLERLPRIPQRLRSTYIYIYTYIYVYMYTYMYIDVYINMETQLSVHIVFVQVIANVAPGPCPWTPSVFNTPSSRLAR